MGRKSRRRPRPAPRPLPSDPGSLLGSQTVEGPSWDFGRPYVMRQMSSAAAVKFYVCPGCNSNIPPGMAHIVAWPSGHGGQADERRHWHRHCWERR